ncbi:MAG TPA: glycosyltransferase, partial [Ktedonobacterales bacterium]|nr:glycosyltransferase [Ktedonobacterales bacterium]
RTGLVLLPVELVLLLWWGGWRRAWMGAIVTALGMALGGALFAWSAAYVDVGSTVVEHVNRANQGILFGAAGAPVWMVGLLAASCVALTVAFVVFFTRGTLGDTALSFDGSNSIAPKDTPDASIRMPINKIYTRVDRPGHSPVSGDMYRSGHNGHNGHSHVEQFWAENQRSSGSTSTSMATVRGFAYRTRYYLVIALALVTVVVGSYAAYRAYKLTELAAQTTTSDPFESSFSAQNSSTQGHLASYEELPRIIIQHPLGYGIGSSGFVGVRNHTSLGAESAYLPVGVELGFPGLLLYLGAFLGALYASWRAFRARGSSLERAVYLGMTIAWVFLLIDGVVTEVTLNFFVMYLLWWMTGAAITHTRASRITVSPTTGEMKPVRPLRIAVDMQALHTARTGVLTYLTELLDQFQATDAPHAIKLLQGPQRLDNSKRLNRVINQGVSFIWLHFWLPIKLAFGSYDILFSPEYITPLWAPVARVVTYHASSFLRRPQDYNRLWLRMFRWITLPAIRRADAILVPSRYAAEEAVE